MTWGRNGEGRIHGRALIASGEREGTRLLPATTAGRAQVLSWLMFEQENVISGIAAPRFWRMTGRADSSLVAARQRRGRDALSRLDEHLQGRDFLLGVFSIADIAVFAYTHVSADAGISLDEFANVSRWIARVRAQPRFINDFVAYPANAVPTVSRSIYD